MKDRETASRTSELLPCLKKWPASPPPLSHTPSCHSPLFLRGTPVCSVGDDKCNRLSLVCSGSEQERNRDKAEVFRKNCISVQQCILLISLTLASADSSGGILIRRQWLNFLFCPVESMLLMLWSPLFWTGYFNLQFLELHYRSNYKDLDTLVRCLNNDIQLWQLAKSWFVFYCSLLKSDIP